MFVGGEVYMGDVRSAILRDGDGRPERKQDPVVDEWTPRHDLVALLKAIGHRNYEIGERLGYDPAYVSRILADPRAKQRVSELVAQVADNAVDVGVKLQLLANEAVETAVRWMRRREDELAAVSVRSAFGILDRAGYSKIERSISANIDIPFEKIDEMTRLARDANRVSIEFNYGREIDPAGSPDDTQGTEE